MKNPDLQQETQPETKLEEGVGWAVCLWLAGCVAAFVLLSLHWPLVGDVTYLHYAVFLMHHGMVPYREIVDMNLPGAYMLEGSVMASFGEGASGWRAYDLLLMTIATLSIFSILRPQGRVAGVLAAGLFILVHAQDGEIMSGERDFAVAVFLLAAVALMFWSLRTFGRSYMKWCGFGALLAAAVCIKPTVAPLAFALTGCAGWTLHCRMVRVTPAALAAMIGALLPCVATVMFLIRHDALSGFAEALRGLIPYHASLAHKSFGFLLGHSVAPLLPLVIAWVVAAVLLHKRVKVDPERVALLVCAAGGLLSYLLQAKGFAYQRYPFLGFLLVLMAADFVRLARVRDAVRVVGVVGVLAGVVFCTVFLLRAEKFERNEPERPLLSDLRGLGVEDGQIEDGQVQCMDTAGSCIDNLYAGQIVQSTGFLYDCYMLDGTNAAALKLRKRFWEAMERNPPRLIVVTDSNCYDPKPSFDKFEKWPEFSAYLADRYSLAKTSGEQQPVRYWSRAVTPFAYRIYVRR